MKKTSTRILLIAVIAVALWAGMALTDYLRVSAFEKPVFCLLDVKNSFEDGGSGRYRGLGYSFDIMGHFMPEDEYPGVTQYTYYIFGHEIKQGIRD